MRNCKHSCVLVLSVLLLCSGVSRTNAADVAAVLDEFAKDWPDGRTPYRTTEDTTSWKTYALSMKRLVAMGDAAVPGLINGCDHPSFQVRGLSARVLGFLNAKAAVPKLVELLDDTSAPVALLAADALGQIRHPAGLKALQAARRRLKNGDVLLHVSKALQRQTPLEEDVREQLLKIDAQSIDLVKVGQPAPDFALKDATGKAWTLSDFRGKKAVVLVFIYGDG